jgi:hypothetical protein
MKISYTQTKYKETNKSGSVINWYRSNTGAWVLDPLEIGAALGLTKKATLAACKLIPEPLQTTHMHRVGIELLLRQLVAETEGRSRKLWNLVKDSFYQTDIESKWDIPVLTYRQVAKMVLAVDAVMLQKYKVHPAEGGTWASEDCIVVEVGNVLLKVIPLSKLITLDAQYNEFAAKVLALENDATLIDYKACIKSASKIKQLSAETEPMDEKAKSFKLRKDLNTALVETEKLRSLLHKHGIDPAGRATVASNVLVKSTDKGAASLAKQKESVHKSLQGYVAQCHGLLKAQACLLEAASNELHSTNPKWNHKGFIQLFNNECALSVLRAAQDDLKANDEDTNDLVNVERFIMNHMGLKLPLLREIVESAQQLDRDNELKKRRQ